MHQFLSTSTSLRILLGPFSDFYLVGSFGEETQIMLKHSVALLTALGFSALALAQEPPLATPRAPAKPLALPALAAPAALAPPVVVDAPAAKPATVATPKNQPRIYSYPTPVHPLCLGCQGLSFPPPPPRFMPPCLPYMPFQGMVPAQIQMNSGYNPYTRSPRDFFMMDIPGK